MDVSVGVRHYFVCVLRRAQDINKSLLNENELDYDELCRAFIAKLNENKSLVHLYDK